MTNDVEENSVVHVVKVGVGDSCCSILEGDGYGFEGVHDESEWAIVRTTRSGRDEDGLNAGLVVNPPPFITC